MSDFWCKLDWFCSFGTEVLSNADEFVTGADITESLATDFGDRRLSDITCEKNPTLNSSISSVLI
ncbi:hypothetical protein NBRC116495_10720 [Aurantivibrio plasticivorans]